MRKEGKIHDSRVSGIRCLLLSSVEPEGGGQDPQLRVSGIRGFLLILVEPEEGGARSTTQVKFSIKLSIFGQKSLILSDPNSGHFPS
jgi:hypothetical protein